MTIDSKKPSNDHRTKFPAVNRQLSSVNPYGFLKKCSRIFCCIFAPQKIANLNFWMMILPIVAYGHPVLRSVATDIEESYADLPKFIEDMWETMYASNGVGLAAPQVNRSIRVFVMDSAQIFANKDEDDEDQFPDAPGIKQAFINPKIIELQGDNWAYNEGCLSIPKIREKIK